MTLQKMIQLISFACMLTAPVASMADTIISGDLNLRDGGKLYFPNGSFQDKAQMVGPKGDTGAQGPVAPITLSAICAAITAGGAQLPSFCQVVSNSPPTANAGAAQSVATCSVVTLDGSASNNANGDLLSYSWAFTSKPVSSSATLSSATVAKPTFRADVAGAYVLNLVVNDGKLFSTPAQVTDTATTANDPPGTIVKKIPFPFGVTWIGDMVYVVSDNTVWFLAGNLTVLNKFMQIDATGAVLKTVPNLTFWINHGSELASDGANLWATSYGTNGVPQSYIYKIDPLTGLVVTSFPCPASSTGGFCEGIAWDGSKLWSAASDNKNLVSYLTDGTLQSLFLNEFSTIGTNTHLSYHSSQRRIIAFQDGITLIYPSSGAITASNVLIYPHSSGWDGQNIWRANNSTQEIEVVFLGL